MRLGPPRSRKTERSGNDGARKTGLADSWMPGAMGRSKSPGEFLALICRPPGSALGWSPGAQFAFVAKSQGSISADSALGQFGQPGSISAAMTHGRRPMPSHATTNVPRTRRPHADFLRRIAAMPLNFQPQLSPCPIDTVPSGLFRSYCEIYLQHGIANNNSNGKSRSGYRPWRRPTAFTYAGTCMSDNNRMNYG